jgi:hypothetical protein
MTIAEESGFAANSAMVSGLGLTALVGFGAIKFRSYLNFSVHIFGANGTGTYFPLFGPMTMETFDREQS